MSRYGDVAVRAVTIVAEDNVSPKSAWEKAVREFYPSSESSQWKACPRNTFLGLCEDGIIDGVKNGDYCRSKNNKEYALRAVALLTKNPELALDEKELWSRVGGTTTPNSQMDIVISLWNAGLICDG